MTAVAAGWALTVAGAHPVALDARAVSETQSHTFSPREGQTWSVTADIATVRILGEAARRDVRVDITRQAAVAAHLARLPVVTRETEGGPEVIVRQADGALDPSLRTEITITAPATGSHGSIAVVEGALDVRGYHGRLEATVTRGPIAASDVSGVLRFESTIGSVEVTGARLEPGGLLRLRTFNGDLHLALAEWPRDARLMALALNGVIQSAVPLTMKDGWGPRWGEATFGTGEHVVSLDVVTGTIRIEAPAVRR